MQGAGGVMKNLVKERLMHKEKKSSSSQSSVQLQVNVFGTLAQL